MINANSPIVVVEIERSTLPITSNLEVVVTPIAIGAATASVATQVAAGQTVSIIGTGELVDNVVTWDASTLARIAALVALGWPLTNIIINYVIVEAVSLTAANGSVTPTSSSATLTGTLLASNASLTPVATSGELEEYIAGALTANDASTTPTATIALLTGVLAASDATMTPTVTVGTLVGTLVGDNAATTPTSDTSTMTGLLSGDNASSTPTSSVSTLVGILAAVNASTTPTATVAILEAGATAPTQPVISSTPGNTEVVIALTSGGVGATSYDVKWGTVSGTRSNTISGVTLPYTHTGRTNGVEYFYSLVATNTAGSTESAEVSATPDAAIINESFTSGLGVFSNIVGTASVAGGYVELELGERINGPCTISKGCYIEVVFTSPDTGTLHININNSSTNEFATGYMSKLIQAYDDEENFWYYRVHEVVKTNGTIPINLDTPVAILEDDAQYVNTETFRFEFLANNTILIKNNGVTVVTGADNDYSSFTHLWLVNFSGTVLIHSVKVGSL